jgi:hypothetical protein
VPRCAHRRATADQVVARDAGGRAHLFTDQSFRRQAPSKHITAVGQDARSSDDTCGQGRHLGFGGLGFSSKS